MWPPSFSLILNIRVKRVLLLGGGGLFGAFQAGVWTEIYERMKFDAVVGVSAGALNGLCIAGGMSGPELERIWRGSGKIAALNLRLPRRWYSGLLDTDPLESYVRQLARDWPPRLEFGVVVSQGLTFQQRLLRGPMADVDAILASCAIPGALPGRLLSGKVTFDGGLRDACPIWAAEEMGATEIVAVNVWAHLPVWWPRARPERRGAKHLTLIEPPELLGPLRYSAIWDSDRVQEWILLGRQTAAALLP